MTTSALDDPVPVSFFTGPDSKLGEIKISQKSSSDFLKTLDYEKNKHTPLLGTVELIFGPNSRTQRMFKVPGLHMACHQDVQSYYAWNFKMPSLFPLDHLPFHFFAWNIRQHKSELLTTLLISIINYANTRCFS